MPLFRRSAKRAAKSAAKQTTTPESTTSAPVARVLTPPPIPEPSFVSEHRDLDTVEFKLQVLQERQEARARGEMAPTTARVNGLDLRAVIDLTKDSDFDARFEAFASHAADLRARGWIE